MVLEVFKFLWIFKFGGIKLTFLSGKFSFKEIETQYDLIKNLLPDPDKYRDAIDAIKKDITNMPLEFKKT